jgi:hypothetical protein
MERVTSSTATVLLLALLLAGAGSLMSIVCTAISWWLSPPTA